MKNILKVAACLSLCVSLNSFGSIILPSALNSGYWNYTNGFNNITSPQALSNLIDGDLNSGIIISGFELSTVSSEFGPFAEIEFNLPLSTQEVEINIAASTNIRDGLGGFLGFYVPDPYNQNNHQIIHYNSDINIDDGISLFSFSFNQNGNTGNELSELTLNQVVNQNILKIIVHGPFSAGLSLPGLPKIYLNEANILASPVPLPAGIYLFLSGLVGLGLMRGRNG